MRIAVGSGNPDLDGVLVAACRDAGHDATACAYATAVAQRAADTDVAVVGLALPSEEGGVLGLIVSLRLKGLQVVVLGGNRQHVDRDLLTELVAVGVYDYVWDPVQSQVVLAAVGQGATLRQALEVLRQPGQGVMPIRALGAALRRVVLARPMREPTKMPEPTKAVVVEPAVAVASSVAVSSPAPARPKRLVLDHLSEVRPRRRRIEPEATNEDSAWWQWPDLDALAAEAGRTYDIGLAVLGALPRVGATTALVRWAERRGDAAIWALVDANLDRPGGLALAAAVAPSRHGWWGGTAETMTRLPSGAVVIGPGSIGGGGEDDAIAGASGDEAATRLTDACRILRAGVVRAVAVDLGSPLPLTRGSRAHPLVRLAAEAGAVAVVMRQDAHSIYATTRLLNALRACGATCVAVWVAAYDTSDPVTLDELREIFGCPVEEAPHS